MTTPTELLCYRFPHKFGIFLNYTRAHRFDDQPDYSYLRRLIRGLFACEGYQYDHGQGGARGKGMLTGPEAGAAALAQARARAEEKSIEDGLPRATERTHQTISCY